MKRRATLRLVLLLLIAAISIAVAVLIGSVTLDWQGVVDGGMSRTILLELRLPRALGAFACGGLLALAGALMQVLLRNPLADPYVLGVSGGAAVGALLAMLLGGAALVVGGAAFSGAFAAMLLVFALAHGEGSWTQTRLLLTGVIVASGSGAVVTLILAMAPEQALRGMLFWLMGDAGEISDPWPALALLGIGLAIALPFARDLNALARGEVLAQALGVRVGRLRGLVYFLAALLTAGAVTTAGSIGFVGLVVPHLARMLIGNDQRLLLPTAVLAGGTLLTLADTLARTIIAPQQLPVGVLTALLGVPLFLFLLSRQPKTP
jgi:iron complex transport system permease protein